MAGFGGDQHNILHSGKDAKVRIEILFVCVASYLQAHMHLMSYRGMN